MDVRLQAQMAGACLLLLAAGAAAPLRGEAPRPRPRNVGAHPGGVASIHFSPDGKLLATGGGDRLIRVCEPATGKVVHEWNGPSSFTCAVRFSPDGKFVAAGGYETEKGNPIYLYDVATGKELPTLPGHPSGGARRVAFSPDSKTLFSAGFDGTVRAWDLATRKETFKVQVEGGTVYDLAVSSDGKTLATAGREGVKLWEAATGKDVSKPDLAQHSAVSVAFSADGKLIASGDGNAVKIWEAATGKSVRQLDGHKGEVSQVLFSADGRLLYTASYDRLVRAWEVETGRVVHQLEAHTGWVWGLTLSPDEKRMATCSVDTTVLTWDLMLVAKAAGPAPRLTAKQLDELWKSLTGPDAGAAYRAVWALAGDPGTSLPLLEERLTAARTSGPTAADVERMIRDLNADVYRARERASADLARAGARALPALKTALAHPASPEARNRIRRLLSQIDPTALPPEDLIALRGVQAVEYIGTARARRLLKRLSSGDGHARLGEEAARALKRLERGSGDGPR